MNATAIPGTLAGRPDNRTLVARRRCWTGNTWHRIIQKDTKRWQRVSSLKTTTLLLTVRRQRRRNICTFDSQRRHYSRRTGGKTAKGRWYGSFLERSAGRATAGINRVRHLGKWFVKEDGSGNLRSSNLTILSAVRWMKAGWRRLTLRTHRLMTGRHQGPIHTPDIPFRLYLSLPL